MKYLIKTIKDEHLIAETYCYENALRIAGSMFQKYKEGIAIILVSETVISTLTPTPYSKNGKLTPQNLDIKDR